MIKLEIKDINYELKEDELKENQPFCQLVELEIGIENEEGADLFRFTLCNKLGLLLLFEQSKTSRLDKIFTYDSLNCYNLVICEVFDENKLIEWINSHLKRVGRLSSDWKSAARILNRTFYWEYENEDIGFQNSILWD